MIIVYVVETYTEGLGYIDNLLPVSMAKLGYEVHIITSRLPMYYQNKTGHRFVSESFPHLHTEHRNGVFIHTLDPIFIGSRIILRDFKKKLLQLNPSVVVVRGLASPVLGQVILSKFFSNFRVFTSTGMAYSAASPALKKEGLNFTKAFNFVTRKMPGRILASFVSKCIGSTNDCVDAAVDFYGVPRSKTEMIPLGVDTDKYVPVTNELFEAERAQMRAMLGFAANDIICIWTGRITPTKGIEILAQAVEELNAEGFAIKALFVGSGDYSKVLSNYTQSKLIDFQPWADLPKYYRMCDIAVWPKSLTTSTLDAAACGLPIIMSDKEPATERWQGAGASYKEADVEDLKRTILSFLDHDTRERLKYIAHSKMKENYSWDFIAKRFIDSFESV
ncbi:glycosyltransferase family 4 protein [Alishewanella jeotgali]|uniref:Glycosyltransferase n=1 Tax=Alishewanella jeotgali KCTC 22429 TaxID=1129374 RepID=H3ZAY3_9ALTE|nr:glycosyltransferase family 4 protein [Alishewanella jeotgali]EHR42097.1 glycosyltransferase [Alishewanella jeotgali KCTC 22429]